MTTIIIDGGESGMMAVISTSKNNDIFYLVEKNEKLGKKMFITAKVDVILQMFPQEKAFLIIQLKIKTLCILRNDFKNEDTMKFFKDNNYDIKVERGDRVFPKRDITGDVIDALKKCIKNSKVKV